MRRAALVAIVAMVGLSIVGMETPASALTVSRSSTEIASTVHWPCPGPDPAEHFTLVFRDTTYKRDGVGVMVISHVTWRGTLVNRTTGALVRDDSTWNQVFTFNTTGKRIVRTVTTGAVWRLTIPGHGIVVHQSGRSVTEGNDTWSTPFGGLTNPSPMCAYV